MAEFTVDTDLDVTDDNDGLLSLREAVALANARPGADTITFATGVDLVRLTQRTQIEITETLTIEGGSGVTITGDAEGDDRTLAGTAITDLAPSFSALDDNTRLFVVSGVDATFRDLILTGGWTTADGAKGGAVLDNSTLERAELTFERVTLAGNETRGAGAQGGAVYASNATFLDSTISGNRTLGDGADGGGLFTLYDGTLINSTVVGNAAYGADATGGGLYLSYASLTNVTVTGNLAGSVGGGLQTFGAATLTDSILVGNDAGTGDATDDISLGSASSARFTFEGRNLVGEGFAVAGVIGVENASPSEVFAQVEGGAGVLADNGGQTETILIQAGGAAQDAGTGSTQTFDQRGEARPFGSARDIGAVELQEAASLVVTTQADGFREDGETSLREAVAFANINPGAETITFASGVELIRLTQGTEIEITDTLTIEGGSGVTITGDAGGNDETVAGTDITDLDATDGHNLTDNTRLFNVTSEVDTTFRNLVLTGGRTAEFQTGDGGALRSSGSVMLERSTVSGNATLGEDSPGGGLFADVATLTNVTISGNATRGDSSDGGGLFANEARLTNVTVSGNATAGYLARGGGLLVLGEANLTNVTVSGNSTAGDNAPGGGVSVRGGATLTDVTLSGNATTGYRANGGGLYARGAANLTNVTISGNSTAGDGAEGGGVFTRNDANLTNVTVSGNRTSGENAEGGGLFVYGGAKAALTDSIVLGNASAQGADEIGLYEGGGRDPGTVIFAGANIVGADAAAFDATVSDNVVNAAPSAVFAQVADGAGVLGDNGGPTQTTLILAGGPAQGTGGGADGPATDQRGVARPVGEGRDIGAVELRSPPVLGDDRVILPFQSNFIRIATLLENDSDATGAEIDPGFIQPAPFEIVRFVNLDLGLTQTAVATLAADPVGPDGGGGGSVSFTYGYTNDDGVPADPAEVVVQMAAQLRLREVTAEADAGARAVVDLSALREGGFGEVTISLGPLRATDGGGGGIGSVALSGTDLVFTAGAGAEGRAGAVDVTIVDTLGQVSGATVALEVAEAPGEDGGGGGGSGGTPDLPGDVDGGGTGGDPAGGDGGGGGAPAPGEGSGDGGPGAPEDTPDAPAPEDDAGRTLLRGTEGRDRIFGTAADERFEGLGARDVLVSGGGDDLMIGGGGPDFFAFARVNAPGTTEVADFGPRDFIVLDDQFFGLGDATIDLRVVTLDQVLTAVRAGLVALDREAGTLSVDPGRDARGEAPELTIALGDGLSDLGVNDVFLA